ncbi:MAG TPA: hypothetical protein VGK16_13820 [Candidatus Limnocylindrales bacterium]
MDERLGSTETAPTGRQWAHGVGFIIVALALLIGIPAALLAAASPSCACTPPADLIVLNYAHEDVAVSWQGPGLFGLPILGVSGSAVAAACATFSQSLRPGQVDVTLRAGGETRTVAVAVPEGEARYGHSATVVVGPDGRISGPSDGSPAGGYPQDPLCS